MILLTSQLRAAVPGENMCYAIPGQLIEIRKNGGGVVDYFGEKRNILLDLSDAAVGDYVYAQGGILVRKIPTAEALEILSLWKDKFFELKKWMRGCPIFQKATCRPIHYKFYKK